jgi:hypothetical protein
MQHRMLGMVFAEAVFGALGRMWLAGVLGRCLFSVQYY